MISFVYRAIECRKSSNRAEEELERFDPQVVICIGHKGVESGSTLAWVELSLNPILPTKINVAGRYLERANPTVEEFLEVIDEVG